MDSALIIGLAAAISSSVTGVIVALINKRSNAGSLQKSLAETSKQVVDNVRQEYSELVLRLDKLEEDLVEEKGKSDQYRQELLEEKRLNNIYKQELIAWNRTRQQLAAMVLLWQGQMAEHGITPNAAVPPRLYDPINIPE